MQLKKILNQKNIGSDIAFAARLNSLIELTQGIMQQYASAPDYKPVPTEVMIYQEHLKRRVQELSTKVENSKSLTSPKSSKENKSSEPEPEAPASPVRGNRKKQLEEAEQKQQENKAAELANTSDKMSKYLENVLSEKELFPLAPDDEDSSPEEATSKPGLAEKLKNKVGSIKSPFKSTKPEENHNREKKQPNDAGTAEIYYIKDEINHAGGIAAYIKKISNNGTTTRQLSNAAVKQKTEIALVEKLALVPPKI